MYILSRKYCVLKAIRSYIYGKKKSYFIIDKCIFEYIGYVRLCGHSNGSCRMPLGGWEDIILRPEPISFQINGQDIDVEAEGFRTDSFISRT